MGMLSALSQPLRRIRCVREKKAEIVLLTRPGSFAAFRYAQKNVGKLVSNIDQV